MKTAMLLLFLAVATVSRTGEFTNGRTWVDMSHQEKVGYVLGLNDGMMSTLAASGADNNPAIGILNVYFGKSKFGEIVAGLDDFYHDPANLQISVTTAMAFFQAKVNGASPESLAKTLADYRKFAAEHGDH